MRYALALMGLALVAATAPSAALAEGGNGYVELRGGVAGASGTSSETIGLALGYDFDIGSQAFLGAELVADTDSSFADPIYGLNARLGFKSGERSKIFATLGYAWSNYSGVIAIPTGNGGAIAVPISGSYDDFAAGFGFQHDIGQSSYLSLQYQNYFDTGINRASIGFGIKF